MLLCPRYRYLSVVSLVLAVTALLVTYTYSPAPSRIRPPLPAKHRFVARHGYLPEFVSKQQSSPRKQRFVSSQRHGSLSSSVTKERMTTEYVSNSTNSIPRTTGYIGEIGEWMKSRVNDLKIAKALLFDGLNSRSKLIKVFQSHEIDAEEKAVMIDLFRKVWEVKKANNFTMFIYGGTLLGSWRHHGLIPYDDDVDTASPVEFSTPLFKALKKLEPTYQVVESGGRLKFFSPIYSTHKTGYSWKWPFVDLQFYYENKTHIWDISGYFTKFKYPKSMIFPLKLRPFEGDWYEAPKHVSSFQELYYGDLEWCETGSWNHMLEKQVKVVRIKCDDLKEIWPFVSSRKTVNGRYVEVLTRGDETIRKVVFPT